MASTIKADLVFPALLDAILIIFSFSGGILRLNGIFSSPPFLNTVSHLYKMYYIFDLESTQIFRRAAFFL